MNLSNKFIDTKSFMSDAKFFESYSRWIDEKGRYETWDESVDRVMDMHKVKYADKLSDKLLKHIEFATEAYKAQLVAGSQRALQYGGPQLLKNHMKLYNCLGSYADRPAFFGEAFWLLLCGCGDGFSVQKHHVAKLPKIKNRTKQPKTYIVEDSIEGWASALDVLMSSYFVGGGKHPEYEGRKVYFDLSYIRPKGAHISGGFKAPGPDPLRLALDRIEHLIQGLIIKEQSDTLRPIHVYDIIMHSADAVIAGGVRRSATICLFSKDDEEMSKAKIGNWFMENPQRGRSNNSALILRDKITREEFHGLFENIKQFGEPGFYFASSTEHATNPCVEIGFYCYDEQTGLTGWQGCNLCEINGGAMVSEETFYATCRAAAILGTLQAGYTDFRFVDEVTKRIFEREALLGVSITGWMANPKILFDEKILQKGVDIIRETNKEIAALIGINQAARLTCVKPSGNSSVLLKSPSGIHGDHSPMYLRNMQMNKESEVVQLIKKTNPYMIEESVWSPSKTDWVVSFPVVANKGSIFKQDILGVKHLELVKKVQKYWVDYGTNLELCVDNTVRHNVSNTITVDDWDSVEAYLFDNRDSFTGVSFIPNTGDKDYNQAPFTAVLDEKEIVKTYGTGAIFASGLIVDGMKAFNNDLWLALSTVAGFGLKLSDDADDLLKKDWVRRFNQFAENYFDGSLKEAEYCLKDVHLFHKFVKIQKHLHTIDFSTSLQAKKFVDVDTLAAAACVGTEEGCLV